MSFIQKALGVQPELRDVLDGGPGEPQAVFAQVGTVTYTDTTEKTLFELPEGAVILDIIVDVVTAFDDGTSNVLDIGDGTTANHYVNDLDVSATGQTVTGWSNLGAVTNLPVTATYVSGGGTETAGEATVTVLYAAS